MMVAARFALLLIMLTTAGCAEYSFPSPIPAGPLRDGQCARGQAFLRNPMSAERRLEITDGLRAQGCMLGSPACKRAGPTGLERACPMW